MRSKLDDKLEKCIFISYIERSKAYKLYNPVTKKIVISQDVRFDENSMFEEMEVEDGNLPNFPFQLEEEEFVENEDQGENPPNSSSSSPSSPEVAR